MFYHLIPFTSLFPPLDLPPQRPNTDPRSNLPLTDTTPPPAVSSSLHLPAWQFFLRDYPNPTFVSTISHIIQFGASIGFSGPQSVQVCSNLSSASEAGNKILEDINSQLQNNRAHGPFDVPPLPNFRCSPLGSVAKKRTTKRRRIHHLSWPHGSSVNDGIPDSEGAIQYELLRDAINTIRSYGTGTLLAKLDLKDAFRQIPVRTADWNLLGYTWLGKLYYDIVLAFGLKSAPYIFNLFAEALHWIIKHHIPASLKHYLDDFLPIFPPSTPYKTAESAVQWIQGLGEVLGLSFQHEKTVWPTTCLEFLGIILDTTRMEARLPTDKLTYLKELLTTWTQHQSCTLRELQELTGFLQFASQVIPYSRAFIRRLLDFSGTFQNQFSRRHIPTSAKQDIHWWLSFSESWNGIHLIQPTQPTLHIYTDASGTKGIGGVFGLCWFSSRIPRRYRSRDIQFKEIFAVQDAILRWGSSLAGHHVVFHVDNQAIVACLTETTIRSPPSMGALRLILMLAACIGFTFTSVWIPTNDNTIADAASRFQYSRMFDANPNLNRKPCSKDPRILGIKSTLTTHTRSHSTSGMASHTQHAAPIQPDRRASWSMPSCTTAATRMARSFQHPRQQLWSGSHLSAPGASSQLQSKPISATSALSMSTVASHSRQQKAQPSSESSAASSVTMARKKKGHVSPSLSPSSSSSLDTCSPTSLRTTTQLMQHANWPTADSYAAENLRWSEKISSRAKSTSPADVYSSYHRRTAQPTYRSPFQLRKQTPFEWESPFSLLQHQTRQHAQLHHSAASTQTGSWNPTGLYSQPATITALSREGHSSSVSENAWPHQDRTPPCTLGTVSVEVPPQQQQQPDTQNTKSSFLDAGEVTLTSSISMSLATGYSISPLSSIGSNHPLLLSSLRPTASRPNLARACTPIRTSKRSI